MSLSNQPLPPPRRCDSFRERIELFLDGELTGSENLGFLTHLKECDDCAGWWSDEQAISEALLLADLSDSTVTAAPTAVINVPARASSSSFHWHRSVLVALAASILTFVCTIPLWKGAPNEVIAPAEVDTSSGVLIAMANGPLRVRSASEEWREVVEGDVISGAVEVELSDETFAVLDVAGRGSLLLEPGAAISLTGVDLEVGRLTVNLSRGKIKLESADLRVCGTIGDVGYSSWNSTVVAATQLGGDDLFVVHRGNLAVRKSDGTNLVLQPGDALSHDGSLRTDSSRIADIMARLNRETRRARDLAEQLSMANDVQRTLKSQLTLTQAQLVEERVHQDALKLPLSVDEIVAAYLTSVSRMNSVSVSRPDGFAMDVADELRDRGLEGVLALQTAFRTTLAANEQMAVCVALGCLGGSGAVDLLKNISLQNTGSIRRAAVYALERQDVPMLGEHFLAIHRIEGSTALGIRCLQAAAQHGASEGVARLLSMVRDPAAPPRARGHASGALEALNPAYPEIHSFFRTYVAGWSNDQSGWVLYHALRALRTAEDIECVPSLRALLTGRLPSHVRRYVTATLEAFGVTLY